MFRPALLPVFAVGSFFAACCCCCGGGMTPEERAEWEKKEKEREEAEAIEKAESIERVAVLEKSLGAIESVIDLDNPVQQTQCPVADMRAAAGLPSDGPLFRSDLWFAAYEDLPGAEAFGDEGEGGDWKWLTHDDVRRVAKLSSEKPDDFTKSELGKKEHRYLVVFVGSSRVLPGGVDKGILSSGFDGGVWEGGLVVVDLLEGQVVCGAPFSVENSESIDEDEKPIDDFKNNFEVSANKALEGITTDFSVNVVGIF